MANVNQPSGFTPVRYMSGQPYVGASRRFYKDATAGVIAVGDPVIRVTASSDPLGGPEIVRATTGSAVTGVVVAIEPVRTNLAQVGYLAAADIGYVLVADDPRLLFEVQEGGNGTALAVTNIGNCINAITAIDGDTVIGRSKMQIDNNALSSGNTFRLEELVATPDNTVGQYAKWLVSISLTTEENASASTKTNV